MHIWNKTMNYDMNAMI